MRANGWRFLAGRSTWICPSFARVESGAEADHHASAAVRALQFGDMVSQILACSRDRVTRLERASNLVRSLHANAEKDVEESYRLRSLRSPVTSSDVSSGDVELF